MKTLSIRDLRQRWPETEKALQVEHEILITRDSKPVAKLIRYIETVVVSSLAELETEVQLRAKWLGGAITKARYETVSPEPK